jgi:hypothetical protein
MIVFVCNVFRYCKHKIGSYVKGDFDSVNHNELIRGQFFKQITAPTGKVCAYRKSLRLQEKFAPTEKLPPSYSWRLTVDA